MDIEKLREKFLNSNDCIMCGTQRCERTEEWMEGCLKWNNFINKILTDAGQN